MKAIILAAGRGSRMGKLTREQPKCLTKFNGIPLIELQINSITQAGIKEVGVVTGYKSTCLEKYGTKKFYNPNWETTNMLFSLLCAKEWLLQDDCLISYSDIFYGHKIVNDLMKSSDEISIGYDPNWLVLWQKRFKNPLEDAETFRIDEKGYITDIGQKPKTIKEIEGQYMGLLKFKTSFWKNSNFLHIDRGALSMTDFLGRCIKDGVQIKGIKNKNLWFEIDSKKDLDLARTLWKE